MTTEPEGPDEPLTSALPDLRGVPLADLTDTSALDDTLNRIAPDDGRQVLLVAAAFNSSI